MSFKKILVPIDFSDPSRVALHQADKLAGPDSTLVLLHVNPIGGFVIMDWTYTIPPEAISKMQTSAGEELERWAKDLKTPTAKIKSEVALGDAANEIIHHSEKCDLVVMGTHGRRGISRFLLGSVAERVVRGAQCSVLIARAKARSG